MKRKNRFCQNLSKLENKIVGLSTSIGRDEVIISPSPPFNISMIMKNAQFFVFCVLVIILSLSTTKALAISITGLGATQKVRADLIMPDGQGSFPGGLILHTGGGPQKYDIEYGCDFF